MTNLPDRLKKIVELVPDSETVADIGCDHAYVSIELVLQAKAKRALACDINEGPLSSAKSNIINAGLADKIETRLSDGLKEVLPHEADTVVIAGMGGLLMEKILQDRLRDFDTFILSPQSDIEHFRHFLIDNRMIIKDEAMLMEDGKYYTVMTVISPDSSREEEPSAEDFYKNEEDFIYGGILLQKKDETLHKFLLKEKKRYESILQKTQNESIKEAHKHCLKALEGYLC
ncbi:MAG: class I SAM-dependent methyltransferase [Oribacterium sp.]|nr:class I SAM-dependent methyltransferase [Oribacterium sp.]